MAVTFKTVPTLGDVYSEVRTLQGFVLQLIDEVGALRKALADSTADKAASSLKQ